jgi:hypothetical protein
MTYRKAALGLLLITAITTPLMAGKKDIPPEALAKAHSLLKQSAMYVEHSPYSKTIPHLYVGYSKDGQVEQGIAMRGFKTYKWVTAMIVVKPDGDKLVVSDVLVPDIARVKQADKQAKVLAALTDIKMTVVHDAAAGTQTIDAVTGATRYAKRIYLYYDRMAAALVSEMTLPTTPTLKATTTLVP